MLLVLPPEHFTANTIICCMTHDHDEYYGNYCTAVYFVRTCTSLKDLTISAWSEASLVQYTSESECPLHRHARSSEEQLPREDKPLNTHQWPRLNTGGVQNLLTSNRTNLLSDFSTYSSVGVSDSSLMHTNLDLRLRPYYS
jgi:hypothetical protein